MESQKPQISRAPVSLNTVGVDVLHIICGLLLETSPHSLSSLALTSRSICTVAREIQHRSVVLHTHREEGDYAQRQLAYMDGHGLFSSVRRLTVTGTYAIKNGALIETICSAIPRMKGLRDFHMTPRLIRKNIMAMLKERSDVRLHIYLSCAGASLSTCEKWLIDLIGCKSLASLSVVTEYTNAGECLAITRPLKQLWLTCKNLRALTINIFLPQSGCCIYDPPDEYCGFGFAESDVPTPLEEINIGHYPWGLHEREFWANHLDWSRLKRARFETRDLGPMIVPHAPAIEDVSLLSEEDWAMMTRNAHVHDTRLHSLTVPSLNVRSIASMPGSGERLRTLCAHSDEGSPAWRSLGNLEETSISQLIEVCPLLETLEIDMHRNGSWPYAKLQGLATGLPNLRDLTVWFALGNSDAPIEPKVTVQVAAEMFAFLKKHSQSLEKATIHSGAPAPLGLGYPSDEAFWPGSMEMTFICELAERDDERGAGHFYITCKELSDWRLRDDQLHEHVARFREGSQENFAIPRKLSVAVDGPVPYSGPDSGWYL